MWDRARSVDAFATACAVAGAMLIESGAIAGVSNPKAGASGAMEEASSGAPFEGALDGEALRLCKNPTKSCTSSAILFHELMQCVPAFRLRVGDLATFPSTRYHLSRHLLERGIRGDFVELMVEMNGVQRGEIA